MKIAERNSLLRILGGFFLGIIMTLLIGGILWTNRLPVESAGSLRNRIQGDGWFNKYSDEVTKSQLCAEKAQYDYEIFRNMRNERVFWWQDISGWVLLVVVLVIVGIGLWFSWVQFKCDLVKPGTGPKPIHEASFSTTGITVKSSVLGVIILTLSLAFFYLYLVHVYPIKPIAKPGSSSIGTPASTERAK